MPHSARIAWFVAALCSAAAAAAVAFAPFPFGERLEFLLYQREGFAPGAVFRAATGVALAAALFAAIRQGTLPVLWGRSRDQLAASPGVYVAAMAGLLALAAASHLAIGPGVMCLTRDSESYLAFESHRSVGYPLFLWLARSFDEDGAALFPIQVSFLLVALASLAHAVGRLLDDRLAAVVALAFMAGNASLAGYAGYVLAETPFAALLALHLACVAALCARFRWGMAAGAGLALGLAVLVRPAGYAFLGALPGLLLLLASRRIAGTVTIAAMAALPLLAASAANQIRFGFFATQDIGGYSLLGQTAHLIEPDMPSAFGDLPARVAARTAPYRDAIAAARFPHDAWRTAMNAYNPQLYSAVLPEIEAWLAERPVQSRPDPATLAGALAREAIRHDPVGYARQIGANYYGLWLLTFLPHGPVAARIAVCATEPGQVAPDRVTPVDLFWAVATLGQFPASAAALLACWLAIPLWLLSAKRGPAWRFAIYAALGANAYFLGFATTQVALPRYSVVVEPWLVALLVALPAAWRAR